VADVDNSTGNGTELGDADDSSVTVSGFTSGATIEVRDAANATDPLVVSMTGATNAGTNDDTLNLIANADIANNDTFTYKYAIAGINNVNITANDRNNVDAATNKDDGYVFTLTSDASLNKLTIDGSSEVTYISSGNDDALSTIDASASTGNVIITLSLLDGTQGIVVTTGAGDDTITVSNAVTNSDSITTGTGADTITFIADNSIETAIDTITDFDLAATGDTIDNVSGTVGVDVASIDVSAADATGAATDLNAKVTNGIVTLTGKDIAAIDTLAEWIDVVETAGVVKAGAADADAVGTVAFEFDGDTYVYESNDSSNDNTANVQTDNIIKLAGITGVDAVVTAQADNAIMIA
jgi:hypothetical protein